MENKKIIFSVLVLIFLAPVISAMSIDIDMKESFSASEEISFTYTIVSESSQKVEYVASAKCPSAPLPLLEIKTANLEANIPFTETYTYMSSVSEDIEPQTCEAGVGILSPEEILELKSFSIITNPSFEFEVLTCKDLNCVEKTKVFILNEDIYFDYTLEISDVNVIATVTYPDDSTNQLSVPTLIKANQIGTYELEATASKQGYKTITKKVQFGVIGQEADIPYTIRVQDIEDVEGKDGLGTYMLFVVFGVIFILVIFVFIKLFTKLKRRRRRLGQGKLDIEKGLKKKERVIKKKERVLLRRLFRRKKKLPQGKKQKVDKKIQQEKKVLTREKVGVRKEFVKKLGEEKRELQKREKKAGAQEKKNEIRRLLSKGRRQLSMENKWGAKNTYRKMRRLHASLKPGEKNKDLYNQILIFHGRLGKRVK